MADTMIGCMKIKAGETDLPHSPKRILLANWMMDAPTRRTLDGVIAFARDRNLSWEIETMPALMADTLEMLFEKGDFDGIVTDFESWHVFPLVPKTAAPIVFLQKDAAEPPKTLRRVSLMRVRFGDLGRAAARHFLERRGYRSFAYFEARGNLFWSVDRGDAFRDAVASAGLPFMRFSANEETHHAISVRKEMEALSEWLVSLPKAAAVFASDDRAARDILLACRHAGLRVPRDVAILGVNDDEFFCRHLTPNLSSVAMDYEALGRIAAEELWRMMEGGKARRCDLEMPVLGVSARASTAPQGIGGPLVNAALDWIDAHACEGATVADVAKAVHASRPLLDLRFRQLHGGTVLGALNDRRLREVQRLLRETDDSVEAICGKAGFNDTSGLRRLFRMRHGCSMRRWRRINAPDAPRTPQ